MSNLAPHIQGHTRFAVILCCFSDLPPLSIPRAAFADFVGRAGAGGVFDYWKDISYGAIDLTGSDVHGPYTMKYSYVRDGNQGRRAWISEAIRLAAENGVDLSTYYGVIAVVNSNPDDSNDGGRNFALGIREWGQNNWRWCLKCQGLNYAGNPSPGNCPAGGVHDLTRSNDYVLALDMPGFEGENNWRWCHKCHGLAFAANPSLGKCPAGGTHDRTGSGNYTLASGNVKLPGQNNWKLCRKCQGLTYAGNPVLGTCPAGGTHDHAGSRNYTLATAVFAYNSHFNLSFAAHEMGHCFELQHAHCADVVPPAPNADYCDEWDLMGAGTATHSGPRVRFSPVGPGLNAGNLARLGWIPEGRTYTATGVRKTVSLAALSQPAASGYLMARIITSDRIYTVEYRQRSGWDEGLPADSVVIHEMRSPYILGQNNWRWCGKCQGLAYAGSGNGRCPAGGGHSHTASGDYSLISGMPAFMGQNNWKRCLKCQGLAYAGSPSLGSCPAGGLHDHSGSIDYALTAGKTGFSGQNNWRACRKCRGLAFAGNSVLGTCPAGGVHDHDGSFDYTLLNFGTAEPFLVGHWKAGQRWANIERGITVVVESIDPATSSARISL